MRKFTKKTLLLSVIDYICVFYLLLKKMESEEITNHLFNF